MVAIRPGIQADAEPEASPLSASLSAAEAVGTVLSLPDDELDYARAKVALDKVIDHTVDADAVLAEIDRMVETARGLAGPSPTEEAKLAAIRTLLYVSGPWNDHRPFAYDHSDPLGQHLQNKLLHNYIANRLGQCVSMPVLFLILGDRLGLDMALANAPEHLFVRYTDQQGRTLNIETTSGGHPARTEWFRRCFPMSDRALRSGLYLRTLTRRESVAAMATTVMEQLRAEGRQEELIAVCGIILEHDPRAGLVMVVQGSAYGRLLHREFEQKYPVPFLIPERLKLRRLFLIERNKTLIEAAEALGWEPNELC